MVEGVASDIKFLTGVAKDEILLCPNWDPRLQNCFGLTLNRRSTL